MLDDLGKSKDLVCVASGKIVGDLPHVRCKVCRHPILSSEARGLVACPLCHAALPLPGDRRR